MASNVQKLVNKVKSGAREIADSLTPTLKASYNVTTKTPPPFLRVIKQLYLPFDLQESKFKESGMITADEFVEAGDHLVYQCPTWSW